MNSNEVLEQNRLLQQIKWNASAGSQISPGGSDQNQIPFIPMWIGIVQNGENFPYDQSIPGFTPLPNPLAIGATWNPDLSEEIGAILGNELSRSGFNLLIGPSLDVLETKLTETTSNHATRSFGGDPYWVSQMGKAYIKGIHEGSDQKVAVVVNHFPGLGSSDRLPEEEVSTIRKSLDELEMFDLIPFFAVTGNATTPGERTDALLSSHIRYQGLQGSIRATTRPVSFDPQALSLLLNLPTLNNWRLSGGVMVSDDLGSLAVRRFYDLTSQTFDARRVSLNAFLSGNDLLYVGDFTSALETDSLQATIRTLEFFSQKYREDTAFAQRVDESIIRLLTLKYSLYDDFTISQVFPAAVNLQTDQNPSPIISEVARQAATLISPSEEDLDEIIPDPPNLNDRIVYITDARTSKLCSQCEEKPILSPGSFQESVIKLYGPLAGGQISSNNLTSYSLRDLDQMLNNDPAFITLERNLQRANWIIFSMLDNSSSQPTYQTLCRFLSERPDLFLQKRLIVFSFSEPNYLDATNISKLTALYSLFSPSQPFIETAAYLLFRELRPSGASPVSIPAVSYDVNQALFPDPDKQILLELDLPTEEAPSVEVTPSPTLPADYRVGDIIPFRTGVIFDHNGNPVPDGTQVTFIFSYGVDATSLQQVEYTNQGVARSVFSISNSGTLEIHAVSENATSNFLRLEIPAVNNGENLTVTPPPEEPTSTPEPSPTNEPVPISTQPAPAEPQKEHPGLIDWMISVLLSLGIAWSTYKLSAFLGKIHWGSRAAFLAFCGGLLAYTYVVLELPGSQILLSVSIATAVFLSTLIGAFSGLTFTYLWKIIYDQKRKEKET